MLYKKFHHISDEIFYYPLSGNLKIFVFLAPTLELKIFIAILCK